jgi:hypothetical protein
MGVAGAAAVAIGVALDPSAPWFFYPVVALAFVAVVSLDWRKISRARPVDGARVEPTSVALRMALPAAASVVLFTLVIEDATLGLMFLGGAVGSAIRATRIRKYEAASAYRVLRRLGRFESRYALSLKDTAPAQRNLAHAQSEAP